jgi:hypothetical protein
VLDLIHAVHAQVVHEIAHSQAGQDRARTGQDLVKEGGVLRHVHDTHTRTVEVHQTLSNFHEHNFSTSDLSSENY